MASRVTLYNQVRQEGNDALMQYVGLVKRVALHLKVRLPPMMELAELIQVGMIGLLEASRSYDPSKGIDFEDFAYNRIRGAIIDEVRRMSTMPRSAIANLKQHSEASQALANQLGRAPRESEIAAFTGKDLKDYQQEGSHAQWYETVSMEAVPEEALNVAAHSSWEPETRVSEAQTMSALQSAITDLPERDKLILSLYYSEGMNLKEIGATIGVSESRVSQILSGNVKKLRSKLGLD
ncbi:MAG: polymerase sigma factor FliA [Pseudomonadota bacterium]|jgi:RNA polymerase sigma factor for flagellar operon FliA